MKFDRIIMNPPYSRGLHLKILTEAIKHLKDDDSVCVNLGPGNWLGKHNINKPISKWKNILNHHISSIEIIEHDVSNKLFGTGNAIEELAITTSINGNATLDLLSWGFISNIEKSIFEKINIFKKDGNIFTLGNACHNGYGTYKGSYDQIQRKEFDVPIYAWHGGKNCKDAVVIKDEAKKISFAFYFNNDIERTNFLNSLDTTFMNWYYRMFIVPGDYKISNFMFRMADYSQPWNDERFKEFFKLTDEEWKYIEDIMKKFR